MQDGEFQTLIKNAKKVEYQIYRYFKDNIDKNTKWAKIDCKEYDLICSAVGNIEIKEDRLAVTTGNYAFEYERADGEPSGIKATTAQQFVIVDQEVVIFINTTALAFLINDCQEKRIIQMGYQTKDGKRALGYLIPRSTLIYSPYAKVVDRWWN